MITEKDLQEAIAECEGQRNPNASTCIKLAAFYTIKEYMFGKTEAGAQPEYSYSPSPQNDSIVEYSGSETEFIQAIQGMPVNDLIALMDEVMSTLSVTQPRLYSSVMRKLI